MKIKLFSFQQLQALGQSLMIPVSVLPGAGLAVALGRYLQISSTQQALQGTIDSSKVNEVITSPIVNSIGKILYSSGLAIFEQLPVVFAIGVAIGFSGGAGIAGLSAAAAYFTLTNLLKTISEIQKLPLAINTGVFGGILAGLLAAYLYKKFHETKLHPVLGFFSGKRLVPILSIFFAVVIGLLLSFVWPPIQNSITDFGSYITDSSLGPAFYAAGKRLLIPVGLHHVYYPSFLFEFGQFITASGEILKGDSPRYFAGDPSAGLFMAAEFPIMLFGLPAAALAMTLRAPSTKRKAIAGIMISAALTSIITGITEPIEFSFIFVAPLLYVIHVVLAFISGLLTYWADLHLGYTFSASLIDFVVGYYNQKNASQLWLLIGPIMSLLYFSSFYALIPFFNFKTPGRDDQIENSNLDDSMSSDPITSKKVDKHSNSLTSKCPKILEALGGSMNILKIDACITRLRLEVKDANKIQDVILKKLGASGIMKMSSGSVQVIFGTESDFIKEELIKLINVEKNIINQFEIGCPLEGKLIPLAQIPDAVFSQGLMGSGIGIEPTGNIIVSPMNGTVASLFHTNHAIGIESPALLNGKKVEILIHVGIDTVKMNGNGFEALVKQGDSVIKGQPLIKFNLDLIKREATSSVTPIIITNIDEFKSFIPASNLEEINFNSTKSIGSVLL